MAKEKSKRKKGKCERCPAITYLEKHHIWPKSIFGGIGPVIKLCPNCHNEYHIELGRKKLKNTDISYHENKFWKWFKTLSIILILIGITIKYWL